VDWVCFFFCGSYTFYLNLEGIDEQMESMSSDSNALPPLNHDRAIHLINLLKQSGDDKCCGCGDTVESLSSESADVSIRGNGNGSSNNSGNGNGGGSCSSICVARCGHLFCWKCRDEFTEGSLCPMCAYPLKAEDIFEMKDSLPVFFFSLIRLYYSKSLRGCGINRIMFLIRWMKRRNPLSPQHCYLLFKVRKFEHWWRTYRIFVKNL
jgi:hypothetical protein